MYKVVMFLCSIGSLLQASSLRLQNEAACPLRAMIYGADGSFQSEVVVESQKTVTWSDSSTPLDRPPVQGTTRSKTPFTVHWICLDGETFSLSEQVATGSLVSARNGTGKKACPPPKKQERGS